MHRPLLLFLAFVFLPGCAGVREFFQKEELSFDSANPSNVAQMKAFTDAVAYLTAGTSVSPPSLIAYDEEILKEAAVVAFEDIRADDVAGVTVEARAPDPAPAPPPGSAEAPPAPPPEPVYQVTLELRSKATGVVNRGKDVVKGAVDKGKNGDTYGAIAAGLFGLAGLLSFATKKRTLKPRASPAPAPAPKPATT